MSTSSRRAGGRSREVNDGFWCKYCGKQKAWDDRDYDFGLYLAEVASFEALGHTEYVTPYLICKQCADEAKMGN